MWSRESRGLIFKDIHPYFDDQCDWAGRTGLLVKHQLLSGFLNLRDSFCGNIRGNLTTLKQLFAIRTTHIHRW